MTKVIEAIPAQPGDSVALALGSGGARGLAHIVVLEALDELGIRPVAIAGCSMGAIIGAAYAAGMSGAELRRHAISLLRDRTQVLARLLKARVGRFSDVFTGRGANPVLLDAERVLDLFWPKLVPDRFEQLDIPFLAVATDFHGRREIFFESGLLAPAVAASMAVPGLLRPVEIDGMVLVDGGIFDPLPYRPLMSRATRVIACDVAGGPPADKTGIPPPYTAMLGAAQLLQVAVTREMLRNSHPDVLVRPDVDGFRMLDFLRVRQILEASEPVKDKLKRELAAVLDRA